MSHVSSGLTDHLRGGDGSFGFWSSACSPDVFWERRFCRNWHPWEKSVWRLVRVEGPIVDCARDRECVANIWRKIRWSKRSCCALIALEGPWLLRKKFIMPSNGYGIPDSQDPSLRRWGSVAASGGYYIAVAADQILANPGTLTGSIGVIMQTANLEQLLEKDWRAKCDYQKWPV